MLLIVVQIINYEFAQDQLAVFIYTLVNEVNVIGPGVKRERNWLGYRIRKNERQERKKSTVKAANVNT